MSVRRSTLATAAALGLAALTLTACEPGGGTGAGSSASASAPATASTPAGATASATPTHRPSPSGSPSTGPTPTPTSTKTPTPTPTRSVAPSPSATPSASASPTGTPTSASPTPTADCTTAANTHIGPVIQVSFLNDSGIVADRAQFHCGPDIPDDGYWQGTGHLSLYPVAPNATFHLFDQADANAGSTGLVTVSKQVFWKVANDCATNPRSAPKPYNCYGNMYAVTLGPGNTITSISELYHP